MESILKNSESSRFCTYPIKYHNLWKFYKNHLKTFWTVEEIKGISEDIVDWKNKLTDSEKYFIKNILAFFASSDGIVNENLVVNFYNEVQISEARSFYAVQIMLESIHSEVYSLLIDTYIQDTQEKEHLFKAIETIPSVEQKAKWAMKWMNKDDSSFAQRLLAFVCVEGIFFSGSFCAIYWLKSKGLMPGLSTANEFISKDENLHTEFAIELYSMLDNKLTTEQVHLIFKEAVEIEDEFITKSLPVSLLGMNCNLMSIYIKFVADRWLTILQYPKLFNVENPFDFMELISVNTKTNFFEVGVAEYNRAGVGQSEEDRTVSFNCDF